MSKRFQISPPKLPAPNFQPPTEDRQSRRLHGFTLKILFLLLSLTGLYLFPKVNLQLSPSPKTNHLSVSFNYPGAGAELVEREATSILEGALSRLNNLVTIESTSSDGQGQIQLEFDKYVSIEDVRLLVSTIVRQVHPSLPDNVHYPRISYQSTFESYPVILVYALLDKNKSHAFKQAIDRDIVLPLSAIKGIYDIEITGLENREAVVELDEYSLRSLDISSDEIRRAIIDGKTREQVGFVSEQHGQITGVNYSATKGGNPMEALRHLVIQNKGNRNIKLTDVADVYDRYELKKRHYRINGLTSVNMVIRADPKVNQIDLAAAIHKKINQIRINTDQVEIIKQADRTIYLKEQLRTIMTRMLVALGILFLFMLLIYRSVRRLWPVWCGFIVTLLLSVIVYYFAGLELHLYSLAGLTLSLGIVLDNLIIMTEHVRHQGNQRIFVALLAATLTTVGALSIIFFISPEYREQLTDFAWIFIINLSMSLLVSLLLIPVITKSEPLSQKYGTRRRRMIKLNRYHKKYVSWTTRRKWIPLTILLLSFGIPLFLLPTKWKKEHKYATAYNKIMEGTYGQEIHPVLSKYLGGTLTLFTRSKDRFYFQRRDPQETKLYINAKMPFGGTTEQLNELVLEFERFLSVFPEVKQYHSRVNNPYNSRIEISFKKEYADGIFPYQLKSRLESMAVDMGSGDFQIYGVGRGFDNELRGAHLSTHLRMLGYNYDQLWKVAEIARKNLLQHMRIQKVFINPTRNYYAPSTQFYQADFDPRTFPEKFFATSLYSLWNSSQPDQGVVADYTSGNTPYPVRLIYPDDKRNTFWNLQNSIYKYDSAHFIKNTNLINLEKRTGSYDIVRHNQQYQLYVEYDFIGNYRLAEKVKTQALKEIAAQLPPGYMISDEKYQWWWRESSDKLTYIVLGSLVLIFFISSILFNSMRQALIPLLLVPPAFIGIFLATHFLEFRFDQGGFAALLLVAGLCVNAGIFILNDYNNFRNKWPTRSRIDLYVKAFNSKIIPVFLTALSTILGLLPFLLFEKNEPFWYALALCTIAGLLFSFIGILGILGIGTKNKL